jgi:aspartate 1-decarboxylase
MLRSMLKSKIHRATITGANLDYEGSLTIDRVLMDTADLLPFEHIKVYNISNGNRFETYVIEGEGIGIYMSERGRCQKRIARRPDHYSII